MYTIYATKKLLDRMQEPAICSVPEATTKLGNWFAKPLFWRPQYALFVNEETFLPVFARLARASSLANRFPDDLAIILRTHGVQKSFIEDELLAMDDVAVSKTSNRRVVGILNELATMATRMAAQDPYLNPTASPSSWLKFLWVFPEGIIGSPKRRFVFSYRLFESNLSNCQFLIAS